MKRPHKLYRNLQSHVNKQGLRWSYKLLPHKIGDTASHAVNITAYDVKMKHPSLKSKVFVKCLGGGHREVFAYFLAERIEVNEPQTIPPEAVRIHFNPRRQERFFQTRDGVKIDFLKVAYLDSDGQCWGII